MRISRLLIIFGFIATSLLGDQLHGIEYGKQQKDAAFVSLIRVLANPQEFTDKRIELWGVIDGFPEGTYLFYTHNHAQWKDISNGIRVELNKDLNKALDDKTRKGLYGRAVLVEGRLVGEKMGEQWYIALVLNHIFIPEDDRQTGK